LDALFELREDKEEVIRFLIRLLGYALTGTCKEAIFAILYGPEGRNGKSTLFKIIIASIGKALAGSIAKELLIDTGKSQQANGPKPDVLDLQGKRIAIAAETQKGDKLNISAIKHYSGGDELGGRGVFGKHNIRFDQTHTLFLHTNFKPHADPGDMAFWARACLIEFIMRFVENPDPKKPNERKYDTGLEKRIIDAELSGVLACLVRGAMDYDENGLRKPQSVQLASEAYRVSEDTLQTFMNECCTVKDGLSIQSSAFITAYREWSGDGLKLTSKDLKKQMEKKGFEPRHTKQGSVYDGIDFVGEGQGPGDSKKGGVTASDSTKNTCHAASEADLDSTGDSSDSSLCKVPHEDSNKNAATKLSDFAVTPVTRGSFNGANAASEADLQSGDRKEIPVTAENLLSPQPAIPDDFTYGDPCVKCGCGIAYDMGGYAVCVRCYPPKGYHSYVHLVDMIYPKKQKAEFGKRGA
jgi:P4 family phage/plasmid primase-like protien